MYFKNYRNRIPASNICLPESMPKSVNWNGSTVLIREAISEASQYASLTSIQKWSINFLLRFRDSFRAMRFCNPVAWSILLDIEDCIGEFKYYPHYIQMLFWGDIYHKERSIIAAFIYINGLNPVLFVEFLEARRLYKINERVAEILSFHKDFDSDPSKYPHIYGFNIAMNRYELLDGTPKFYNKEESAATIQLESKDKFPDDDDSTLVSAVECFERDTFCDSTFLEGDVLEASPLSTCIIECQRDDGVQVAVAGQESVAPVSTPPAIPPGAPPCLADNCQEAPQLDCGDSRPGNNYQTIVRDMPNFDIGAAYFEDWGNSQNKAASSAESSQVSLDTAILYIEKDTQVATHPPTNSDDHHTIQLRGDIHSVATAGPSAIENPQHDTTHGGPSFEYAGNFGPEADSSHSPSHFCRRSAERAAEGSSGVSHVGEAQSAGQSMETDKDAHVPAVVMPAKLRHKKKMAKKVKKEIVVTENFMVDENNLRKITLFPGCQVPISPRQYFGLLLKQEETVRTVEIETDINSSQEKDV